MARRRVAIGLFPAGLLRALLEIHLPLTIALEGVRNYWRFFSTAVNEMHNAIIP